MQCKNFFSIVNKLFKTCFKGAKNPLKPKISYTKSLWMWKTSGICLLILAKAHTALEISWGLQSPARWIKALATSWKKLVEGIYSRVAHAQTVFERCCRLKADALELCRRFMISLTDCSINPCKHFALQSCTFRIIPNTNYHRGFSVTCAMKLERGLKVYKSLKSPGFSQLMWLLQTKKDQSIQICPTGGFRLFSCIAYSTLFSARLQIQF